MAEALSQSTSAPYQAGPTFDDWTKQEAERQFHGASVSFVAEQSCFQQARRFIRRFRERAARVRAAGRPCSPSSTSQGPPRPREAGAGCQFPNWEARDRSGNANSWKRAPEPGKGISFGESYNGLNRIGGNTPTTQGELSLHQFRNAVLVGPRCPKSAPDLKACVSRFEPSSLPGAGFPAVAEFPSPKVEPLVSGKRNATLQKARCKMQEVSRSQRGSESLCRAPWRMGGYWNVVSECMAEAS